MKMLKNQMLPAIQAIIGENFYGFSRTVQHHITQEKCVII